MSKDTLYYDGACPLCRAEVKKLAHFSQRRLVLRDIHKLQDDHGTPGRQRMLSRLYLRTAEGEWLIGLNANIRAWQHTPFSGLWRMLGWPGFRPLAEWGYEFWLRRRNRNTCSTL